jgi:PAS domain S-box-containing protein
MATKVVTFRLPDDIMEAITSQAQATGRPRTAVVIDALKQAFGVPSPKALPTALERSHQQQKTLHQDVADLNQQPVHLKQANVSYIRSGHQQELEQPLAGDRAFLEEGSPNFPKASQPRRVVADLTDTSEGVSQEPKSQGMQDGYKVALQQMAAEVEQRARMLEQVLSASVDHVCMYDRLGRYTYANRAFTQAFQLERPELYGKTWHQVGFPATAMKSFDAKLQITLTTGQSIAEEITLPTVNGNRDYEYILSPIYSADGSIEAVVYTARDITERKQAEELLRESEKNYRNLFEWAHDSIFITDSSTKTLLDVNEHAARRLGYTRKQLLSLPAEEYSPPMEPTQRETILRQLWQTGHVVFEHVHRCKNGMQMPVEISSRVVEYGGQLAIQSFVRDITIRKQAEEKLHLYREIISQARVVEDRGQLAIQSSVRDITVRKPAEEKLNLYREIISHSKDAIAILDLQGCYVQQNPAHRSLLGYSDERLLKRTAAFHLEQNVFAHLIQELSEKGSYKGEVTSRTYNGELLTLELNAFVLRDESAEPAWYLTLLRSK